ncbi:MAG: hypothetical protein U5O15_09360 [Candidatus Krumholzibacteriota bacterium]|nr:hypothetical protein [Candidatus Krumholzibacteriota bacterium]
MESENRKRDHDPLPALRKLLCFGEGVWTALPEAAESARGSGEEKEEELLEELTAEIEIREETKAEYASGEEIFFKARALVREVEMTRDPR